MVRISCLLVLLLLGSGCVSSSVSKTAVSPGEIKISYFQLAKGKSAKEPIGIYVAMVSRERNLKYGTRLDEMLEQINTPEVSVIDDETAGEVFRYLNQEDFFSLSSTPLNEFNINDLKRLTFFTKIISVDINGVQHSVCYEKLLPQQREKFNRIQQAIFLFLTAATPRASIQLQDWRESFKEHLE
ncbi:MAG: hypothetical protein QME51_01805, partial [Planctomycetota bacterium]|nr:hypothetical protein [Planctomycetota bacterium]